MIILIKNVLHDIRKQFKKQYPFIKSSHIAESQAHGYFYKSSVSMNRDIVEKNSFNLLEFNASSFCKSLMQKYPGLILEDIMTSIKQIFHNIPEICILNIISVVYYIKLPQIMLNIEDHKVNVHYSSGTMSYGVRNQEYLLEKAIKIIDLFKYKNVIIPNNVEKINYSIISDRELSLHIVFKDNHYETPFKNMTKEQKNEINNMLSKKNTIGTIFVSGRDDFDNINAIRNLILWKNHITDFNNNVVLDMNLFDISPENKKEFLSSLLRSDPDTLITKELFYDDYDMQKLIIDGSLTGHYVYSPIYGKGVFDTIKRIIKIFKKELHDNKYNLNYLKDIISGIVYQKEIVILCEHCKIQNDKGIYECNDKGCVHCVHGYKKREYIFEVLNITDDILELCINERYEDAQALWKNKYNGLSCDDILKKRYTNEIID